MSTRRPRLVTVGAALCLLVAACSDDDADTAATDPPGDTALEEAAESTTELAAESGDEDEEDEEDSDAVDARTGAEPRTTTEPTTGGGPRALSDTSVMTLTIDLHPDAVWEDGTPITAADLECTWRANLRTPGSIATAGYDRIIDVSAGESDKQAVVEFSSVYGAYKTLFNPVLKSTSVVDCDDVSAEFATEQPVSARPYRIESWSASELVLVPNENYWGDEPLTDRVVVLAQPDPTTEINALRNGQVDFIYPPLSESLARSLEDPNIALDVPRGGDYEALYFQQLEGPFADPVFRAAFSMSIDRQALYAAVYEPIFAANGVVGELLNCGPIVDGPYCPDGNFENTFDPAAATTLLTDAGWAKDASGFWSKDGLVPRIVWMANDGDVRRERAQDHLIPLLTEAGFDVVPDNCDAVCVFQQRLPSLDYDLAMYLAPSRSDPAYLTPLFTCDGIPTEENDFQGRNQQGWCNQAASDALDQADATTDEDERIDLVQRGLRAMDTDHVLLPLVNYPKAAAWRTDRVGGPVSAELANDRAFSNFAAWEDIDGDGQIVIGAGQWPTCLNPVTECANTSWYRWTISSPTLPGVWDTTADRTYEISDLVVDEPTVELAD